MKVGTIVFIVLAAGIAVGATFWMAGSPNVDPKDGNEVTDGTTFDPNLPHPKAVTDETHFEFGAMNVEATGRHAFVVRNEGDAPLKLENKGTTCTCTISDLENDEIPPGGEATIELSWTPKDVFKSFKQRATIGTNDPRRPTIELSVHGSVERTLHLEPRTWELGLVQSDGPIEVVGTIYSRILDEFEVVEFGSLGEDEGDGEEVETTVEPLSPEEREKFGAKSGYRLKAVTRAKGNGAFARHLVLETDVEGSRRFPMRITGRTAGPLRIFPAGQFRYHPADQAITMGRFDAATGKSARVAMIVKNLPESGFEVREIETTTDALKVVVEKDPTFRVDGSERHNVTFEFVAGSPPDTRVKTESVKVYLRTNHPELEEIKFFVEYIAE